MHPRKIVHLFLLISEIMIASIFITFFCCGNAYNYKQLLWIGSKTLTIQNILKNNMNNSYPLKSIQSFEKLNSRFDKNYDYLLKHSTKTNCELNFKRCGILDTYGNIMCIEEKESCPINEIIIDLKDKYEEYITKGFEFTKISKIPNNYYLYYTNKSIDKEIIVNLIYSEEEPKYIKEDNLVFDFEKYSEYLSATTTKSSGNSYFIGISFGGGSSGGGGGGYGIGGGGGYWRNLEILEGEEKINKFFDNKISEDKNIDNYYKKIYENLYIKNYIGFESYEQMDFFMNYDFRKLFFRRFPNLTSFNFTILSFIVFFILIVFSICRFMYEDKNINEPDPSDPGAVTCSKLAVSFFYLAIFIGFFIYFLYAYFKIYKNKQFEIIKNIRADNFIKDFIDEIYERAKSKSLILSSIILFSISFFFFILTWLVRPVHLVYLKYKQNKIQITRNLDKKDEKIINDLESKDIKIINNEENSNNIINNKNNDEENNNKIIGNKSNNEKNNNNNFYSNNNKEDNNIEENNNIFLNNKNNKEENNNNILINKQKNEENNNIILNIRGNIEENNNHILSDKGKNEENNSNILNNKSKIEEKKINNMNNNCEENK